MLWHCAQVLPLPAGIAKDARKALSRFLWAGEPLRVSMVPWAPRPCRQGPGHIPVEVAVSVPVRGAHPVRWLRTLFEDVEAVSPAAKYFQAIRTTLGEVQFPDDVQGQALTRAVMNTMLSNCVAVQLKRPAANWSTIWTRIASRTLPLRTRTAWFRAVHHVLPTNARLKATHQADHAACRTCGGDDTVLHRLVSCQTNSRTISGGGRRGSWPS